MFIVTNRIPVSADFEHEFGINPGKLVGDGFFEMTVGQVGIVAQPSPEHETVPVLVCFQLSWAFGFCAGEFPSPDITVGTHVKADGLGKGRKVLD